MRGRRQSRLALWPARRANEAAIVVGGSNLAVDWEGSVAECGEERTTTLQLSRSMFEVDDGEGAANPVSAQAWPRSQSADSRA